jgi:hypothetical protein
MIENKLISLRTEIKTEICSILSKIYKHFNNGMYPIWDDEEIIVCSDIVGSIRTNIEVSDVYSNETIFEQWLISEYIVSLDGNLFFYFDECDDEMNWEDIETDTLFCIYNHLRRFVKQKNIC